MPINDIIKNKYIVCKSPELLEEERKNLMDAFLDGKVNGNDWFTIPNTVDVDKDQYFNENYEQ